VGVGNRGTSVLKNLLDVPGVVVPAICDINETNLSRAQALVEKSTTGKPEGYMRAWKIIAAWRNAKT
jgi:hypothetical protein